jgi:hypothetical protein
MSRGLGRVERTALGVLQSGKLMSALDVAGAAENLSAIPEATYRSYARALRSLAKAGLAADLGRGFRYGRRYYASPDAAQAYIDRTKRAFGPSFARVDRPLAR